MSDERLKNFYQYLDRISKRGVRPGLERIRAATEIIGNPQNRYRVVHVAGTNGKGSVCQFLAQLIAASGYRVGMSLSPHVDDYRERIQIGGGDGGGMAFIPDEDLLATHEFLLEKIPPSLGLTYFEWGILLALAYFARQEVDFAVLETGLGGRWDATNVCHSVLSAITTIGLDHMEYLGPTHESILREKLEIIKENSYFLFGPTQDNLVRMARAHCANQKARFYHFPDVLPRVSPYLKNSAVFAGLESYLKDNFLFSLALGELLRDRGYGIDVPRFLKNGVLKPPARLQEIRPGVIVDGAHNEEALTVLTGHLKQKYPDGYDLVFGCLSNRPFLKLAKIIRSDHRNYWALFDGGHLTTGRSAYEEVVRQLGGQVVPLSKAFTETLLSGPLKRPIVVCGSFYLCSQFKKAVGV